MPFRRIANQKIPFEKASSRCRRQVIQQAGVDIESGKDPFDSISSKGPLKGLLDEYIKSHTPGGGRGL